ncbi:MAG TPA: SprB repeat-containing protein, partial [Bacteroidia bacterium]|nr:SprB repeat-containing protein [Bacteroidia bacterium]
MNRKLLWLFLIIVSAHQLTAQPTITKKKSSSQPSVAEANNEQTYQATPGKVKWTAGPESMPGNLKAFQEYKGQFLNLINNWKILYGADYGGAKILFTDHGVIYTLAQVYKDSLNEEADKDDDKNKSSEEKEKEKQNLKKIVYRNVAIEWENVNANLTVEAQNETPYYFGSLDPHNNMSSIDHIKGFQKLVYHNVYPGIDVEYTFHKDKGIKYAVIVHPGYNASDFKMLYSGNKGLSIDGNGDVHIGTELGDIIDHAPISSQNGQKVESSFKQLSNNEVAFQVGSTNQSSDLIIDPWTVNPVSNNFLPQDVGMDGSNNVYIMGMNGAYKHYVQKYTTAGALSWTYSLTQYGTVANDVSDLAVDVAGNTYVPGPYGYTNSVGNAWSIISLNTGGTLRYFNNASSPANMFEVWNISYSCDYSELVEGGAPTIEQEEVGVVNSANGNLGGVTTNATYGEIYTGCIAPNGNYYAIAANPCFGCSTPGDDIVCYTLSAGTATFAWNKQSTYQWNDYDFKNPAGISTNGIAASCAYLYTTDGLKLDQRSLTNGTSVKTVTIPGGSNSLSVATGGLGVDMACGYVYAGTAGSVQVYDQNLNAITTQAMPGNVYDVDYNNGLVAACGGAVGSGFVTQFAAQTCATELTITHTNTSCGNNNGTATVATPSFCTGPYTYVWAPGGQTTQTITGLSAGIYTVNVGTSTSCVTVSDTVTIKPSTNVTLTATATGTCTGNVTITVSGGVTPYTYSWSNGATTSNITGVSAGSYTITVTDAAGCVKTATATIAGGVVTITTTQVNELCNGGSTGSSIATASGGTAPYTYLWSNGQTTSTASGLSAGSYTITATSSGGGCSGTATVTITQPSVVTATATNTAALCNGGTGTATVTAGGGTPGYTYSWSNGATTSTITATAGTYTATVKDVNGCTITATTTITQPTAITTTTSTTPSNCASNNGTATVTAAGGTPGYTYLWSNGKTTSNITALSTGSYTVTVKDANNCTVTATVTVANVGATITATTTPTNPLCSGGTGSATVTGPTGGTAPYTYVWSNAQTSTTASPLTSGSYTVTITDANGCSGTETVTITVPTPVTATATNTAALCNGANGTATVTAGGGTPGYIYSWSNGATTSTINATAGTYTATAKDANGCTITATTTITQPTAVTAAATNTRPLCNGGTGTATVTAGGGTPGYTYSWSNGATTSTMNATAGTYTATVKDANGCTITATTTITQPTAVTATASNTPPLCNGGNGTATVTAGGGTPGYTYSWSNGATTSTMSASAGTYTVTVTDANGCTKTATTTITQPSAVTTTITSTPSNCSTNDGTATVTPAGGTPGYTYLWSNAQTASNATGLSTGSYTVTVKDANGCTATATISVVNVGATITATTTPTNVLCNGGTGSATVTGAAGGTGPYTYLWSNAQTTTTATALTVGTYTVTITDANGC